MSLIYFGAELQRQLIPTFHYALRLDGFLCLGTSETIREFTDLFSLTDRRHKIYSRRPGNLPRALVDVLPRSMSTDIQAAPVLHATENWGDLELQRTADRILLSRYAPPGVVINERLEIIQSRGRIGPLLELRPGAATLDLLRMTRESIASQVSIALRRAIKEDLPVQVEHPHAGDGEVVQEATLEVVPIQSVGHRTKCFLVVFAPARIRPDKDRLGIDISPATPDEDQNRLMSQMRHDLSSTKLYLQSLLEERDAKNQELVSANEELQSTNEELETTKEELQSSNEELHTVNEELQNRNAVLTQASNDLLNLLNSVNLPVLM
jgi:two-component system CheB/CheR fusion protein